MANSKNNPDSKHEVARVAKHPGKRDRDVVATPKKEEPVFAVKIYEPKPALRFGLDGMYRIWDRDGHLVKFGKTEVVSVDKMQEYIDGLMSGI